MGAYSTRDITRDEAISRIVDLIYGASNDELANALFSLTCNYTLDNYCVTGEEPESNPYYDP